MKQERYGIDRCKFVVVLSLVVVLVLNIWGYLPVVIGINAAAVLLLVRPVMTKRVRLKSFLPVLFMALVIAISRSIVVGSSPYLSVDFMGITVNLYKEGIGSGVLCFFRVMGSFGTVMLMMSYVGIGEFIRVLKWLRLPMALIEVLTIALKYIFIFKEDMFTIQKAQRARLGYGSFSKSALSIGNLGGIVLSRGYDRSKLLARAMKSRGYDGGDFIKE